MVRILGMLASRSRLERGAASVRDAPVKPSASALSRVPGSRIGTGDRRVGPKRCFALRAVALRATDHEMLNCDKPSHDRVGQGVRPAPP